MSKALLVSTHASMPTLLWDDMHHHNLCFVDLLWDDMHHQNLCFVDEMFATYNKSQILVMNTKLVVKKNTKQWNSLLQITIKLIQSTFVSSIILQTLHTKPTSCQKDVIEIKSKMTLMMTASWEMLLTDWMDAQGFQLERYAPSRFDEDNLSFYML